MKLPSHVDQHDCWISIRFFGIWATRCDLKTSCSFHVGMLHTLMRERDTEWVKETKEVDRGAGEGRVRQIFVVESGYPLLSLIVYYWKKETNERESLRMCQVGWGKELAIEREGTEHVDYLTSRYQIFLISSKTFWDGVSHSHSCFFLRVLHKIEIQTLFPMVECLHVYLGS